MVPGTTSMSPVIDIAVLLTAPYFSANAGEAKANPIKRASIPLRMTQAPGLRRARALLGWKRYIDVSPAALFHRDAAGIGFLAVFALGDEGGVALVPEDEGLILVGVARTRG